MERNRSWIALPNIRPSAVPDEIVITLRTTPLTSPSTPSFRSSVGQPQVLQLARDRVRASRQTRVARDRAARLSCARFARAPPRSSVLASRTSTCDRRALARSRSPALDPTTRPRQAPFDARRNPHDLVVGRSWCAYTISTGTPPPVDSPGPPSPSNTTTIRPLPSRSSPAHAQPRDQRLALLLEAREPRSPDHDG